MIDATVNWVKKGSREQQPYIILQCDENKQKHMTYTYLYICL